MYVYSHTSMRSSTFFEVSNLMVGHLCVQVCMCACLYDVDADLLIQFTNFFPM